MLSELRIDQFAIIQHLELSFEKGLTIFTGETGAGKSIILDAIEAILGWKVDPSLIRAGAERASIEAVFRLEGAAGAAVREILEREDLVDDNPAFVTLAREMRREGRTTARINGRSVSTGLLREVGGLLVDIHGQSEHLSLLNVNQHLDLLDRFSSTSRVLEDYRGLYRRLQTVRRDLAEVRQAEQDAARRADYLSYQVQEIEAARLQPDEEEELRQERNRLANAEGLASLARQSVQLLDEGDPESPAISDLLGQLSHAINGLTRIDPSRAVFSEQAETLLAVASDLGRDLADYLESIEFNPRRLEQVEDRLELIYNLKRKYGGSLEAVLASAEKARAQLDMIIHASERIAELETAEKHLLKELAVLGQRLSAQRKQAAQVMQTGIENELADLKMAGARFSVDFQVQPDPNGLPLDGMTAAFDASGFDRVQFLIAPNPGEGLKPLVKIASGGETARLMLALKNVLARADTIPTLIFDEIDQGIGGRVGLVVGHKLWQLSLAHQVLCITHLPQLAAYGDAHYRVTKQVSGGRTSTVVENLSGEVREQELAQMLGGISAGTLHSAREIMEMVREAQQHKP
ncbi:MAG TPA: DNA repair protein RecN [Anaerolineaceae bacterium]|nr:DNA repair protein RecN [Anaerolineaceae bacterium]HPN52062.1 DNA repair protein RecN [Anaerolineaceae bacterium]